MFHSRSFFTVLITGNLLLIALILGTGFLATTHEVDRRAGRLTERFQEQLLALVRGDLDADWPDIDERVRRYCESYAREPEFRLTVIDAHGRVLGDSEYPSEKMESHLGRDRPEITAALGGTRGEATRKSATKNIAYRYLAEPIVRNGNTVAVVRVAFPVGGFAEQRRLLFRAVLFGFLLMLVAATSLSVLLGWIWYRPLRLISDAAQRISEGNLDTVPTVDGPLEMHRLSRALDSMRRTVSSQLETITKQREGLQAILLNLPDAIFAMNREERIIYYNRAAREMFGLESLETPRRLQGIVRHAGIIDFFLAGRKKLREIGHGSMIERKEIDVDGHKHFLEMELLSLESTLDNTLEGATENDVAAVLILSDLSEMVRANKMKIDFVANASHELRTPLAAIRAALDNITEDVFEDRDTLARIVPIIDRHVMRLDALIEDLLSLYDAENESNTARTEQTDVTEQRAWLEELFYAKIEEKSQTFHIESELDPASESFQIDNKRLGLILQNLVDNAVKFTPVGGTITLRFAREGNDLIVTCEDSGPGILPDERNRVFERFYQGSSSRSGDSRVRGTGLGLAIVKHALERLHGNVVLSGRPGQGTVFTIRIPVTFTSESHR